MEAEKSGANIIVSKAFLKDNPQFTQAQIERVLVEGPWVLPTTEPGFWISEMGGTRYRRPITAGIFIDTNKPLGIFVKPEPKEPFLTAVNEFERSEIARARKINTPPMIAVLECHNVPYVVTQLLRNVRPLSSKDLAFLRVNSIRYSPEDYLRFHLLGIAAMHEHGVVHGDLTLNNIGRQYPEKSSEQNIFFDFENANVLGNNLLYRKHHKQNNLSEEERSTLDQFEYEAVIDLATFLAHLNHAGFPIKGKELFWEVSASYARFRRKSYGVKNELELRALLPEAYYRTILNIEAVA